MATFLAAILVFAAAIVGLSIGVIMNDRCLKGTCGGLNNLPDGHDKSICDVCASLGTTANHDEQETST